MVLHVDEGGAASQRVDGRPGLCGKFAREARQHEVIVAGPSREFVVSKAAIEGIVAVANS